MRRLLLLLLFGSFWFAIADDRPSRENVFAGAYNDWIRMRQATPAGTVNVAAIRQWKVVKQAWRELQRSVE